MLTEDIQLQRKHFLHALETQPEQEMRTRGVMADDGQYCAVGLAATLADIDVPIGLIDCREVYEQVEAAYQMTDWQRDSVIKMNDCVNVEENPDGSVKSISYVNTWTDIAAMLRKEWSMSG